MAVVYFFSCYITTTTHGFGKIMYFQSII